MTSIGIQYLTLLENQRTNRANETIKRATLEETVRSNIVNEGIKQQTLDESIRSHLADEAIRRDQLSETIRSNQAHEGLQLASIQESRRSNLANEAIKSASLSETVRSNKAREAETKRYNTESLAESQRKTDLQTELGFYEANQKYLPESVREVNAMEKMGLDSTANRLAGATNRIWDNLDNVLRIGLGWFTQ